MPLQLARTTSDGTRTNYEDVPETTAANARCKGGGLEPGALDAGRGVREGEGLAGAEGEDAAGGGEELVAVGAVVAVRGHNFRLLLSPERQQRPVGWLVSLPQAGGPAVSVRGG